MSLPGNGLNIWMGSISRDKLSISKTDIAQYSPYKSGFQEGGILLKAFLFGNSTPRIPSKLVHHPTSDICLKNLPFSFISKFFSNSFPFPRYSCSTKFNLLFVGALLTPGCLTSKWKKNDCRGGNLVPLVIYTFKLWLPHPVSSLYIFISFFGK